MNRVIQTGNGNATNNTSDIHSELQAVNQKISELDQECEKLIIKRDTLLQELSSKDRKIQQDVIPQASILLPVSEKVALFKNLFKDRSELFAQRWKSSKGRSGYSVACNNEWVKDVCNKPGIKCNECPNREYTAVSDQVIYDHLAGKQVVGLYPLLSDNSCYLFVADFDKEVQHFTTLTRDFLDDSQSEAVKSLIDDYSSQFEQLVNVEKEKGLDANSGKIAEMRGVVHQAEEILDTLKKQLDIEIVNAVTATHNLLIATLIITGLVVGVSSVFISISISRSLVRFSGEITRVIENKDLTVRLSVSGKNEITDVANNLSAHGIHSLVKISLRANRAA